MSDELLPCPFCGGAAELSHYTQAPAREFYYLVCNGCRVHSPPSGINDNTPDGVIAWWNRRTPSIPADVREAIITLCETFPSHWAARLLRTWLDAQP